MRILSFALISVLFACAHLSLASPTAASPSKTTIATTASTSSSPATTSVIQATRHETAPAAASSGGGYSGYGSNAVDTEGGASGSDTSSFSLSKGGLIAIIVVVVVVAVFGITSIVLYVLAKKRQWNVRQSIKRASRRLTGRNDNLGRRSEVDRRKRSGVIAGSRPAAAPSREPGQKRGVVVDVHDEEKGPLDYGPAPKTKKPGDNTWLQRLWGNDWK